MSEFKLRPSSSSRWMACNGSMYYDLTMENTSSPEADRGTRLHKTADESFKTGSLVDLKTDGIETEEEMEMVNQYLDFIHSKANTNNIHTELFMRHGEFIAGTADVVFVGRDRENPRLEIADFKTGLWKVDPKSSQLMIYLLMAVGHFNINLTDPKVKLYVSVVQPGIDHIVTEEVTVQELLDFLNQVERATDRIYAQYRVDNWMFNPGDDQCAYCLGRSHCKQRRDSLVLGFELEPAHKLTAEQRAEFLHKARSIKKWCEQLESDLVKDALNGEVPPGFMISEGRTLRRWADEHKVEIRAIGLGLAKNEYTETKLLSPAKMEKLTKEDFSDLTIKPKGKPVLVEVDLVKEP
jgi:hypothetical protein